MLAVNGLLLHRCVGCKTQTSVAVQECGIGAVQLQALLANNEHRHLGAILALYKYLHNNILSRQTGSIYKEHAGDHVPKAALVGRHFRLQQGTFVAVRRL